VPQRKKERKAEDFLFLFLFFCIRKRRAGSSLFVFCRIRYVIKNEESKGIEC